MDHAETEAKTPQEGKKKRKRDERDDPLKEAYRNITFEPRTSSGRPGSPHRFFKSSFSVKYKDEKLGRNQTVCEQHSSPGTHQSKEAHVAAQSSAVSPITAEDIPIQQVVHQHANGLCVITVGDSIKWKDKSLGIDMCAKVAPEMSAAERRKSQSKMLKRKTFEKNGSHGIATPEGILCYLDIGGVKRPIYGCVWGHILEINTKLTPELLQNDPLLDGYVAIVLPIGPFPPLQAEAVNDKDELDSKSRKKETGIA